MDMIPCLLESCSTSALVLACFLFVAVRWWSQKPKNAPPGPIGLPYFGSTIQLVRSYRGGKIVDFILELHRKYGRIACVQAGAQRIIYINDGELVAQLFQRDEFATRPIETYPSMKEVSHGAPRGLVFGNGEPHMEMRRFALLSLRDLGVGKKSIDEMIQTEATILCQYLESLAESEQGIMSDLKIKLQYATANVIHHVIFGHRQEYENPQWRHLVRKLYNFFDINFLAFPDNFLPILGQIPLLNGLVSGDMAERFYKGNDELEEYIESQIEDHRSSYVEGDVRDFIDLYIKYETEDMEYYTSANIFGSILDLFRAGSDTAATTLTWSIMHLVRNPDLQTELQDEIDEVVGDRQFDRRDKDKLLKTQAFINEIHRYVSIAVTPPPHTVDRPVNVEGYTLLPNDVVYASLFAIHHDEKYWGDPYTFRIGRWIDEKGELLKHEGHFYPFSVGKRACPGRQFATIELTLILVQFLQNFTFEIAEGYADMTDKQRPGIIRSPQSFHFKVLKRV